MVEKGVYVIMCSAEADRQVLEELLRKLAKEDVHIEWMQGRSVTVVVKTDEGEPSVEDEPETTGEEIDERL